MQALKDFLRLESAGGIILVIAAVLALLVANTPLQPIYHTILDWNLVVGPENYVIDKPLILWINDGLMAIFFFLIGLEIKREILAGELSRPSQLVLPTLAAVGGIAVPALIYVALNSDNGVALNGWAIPAATDIAFALGVLALLGSRVPLALKVLLTTIAIIDDLTAIIIIAVFYSGAISLLALSLASAGIVFLLIINRMGVMRLWPYMLLGAFVWVCVLKSGVHATLAGVIVAMTIPFKGADAPSKWLEHKLHPWVAFGILPIFAFANAGVTLTGLQFSDIFNSVSVGIMLGLFVGKQLGVFSLLWLTIKLGWAQMPNDSNWLALYGVSILTGIGFTMSLFIGTLAFEHGGMAYDAAVRIGVLTGSVLSAVVGYFMMRSALTDKSPNAAVNSPA